MHVPSKHGAPRLPFRHPHSYCMGLVQAEEAKPPIADKAAKRSELESPVEISGTRKRPVPCTRASRAARLPFSSGAASQPHGVFHVLLHEEIRTPQPSCPEVCGSRSVAPAPKKQSASAMLQGQRWRRGYPVVIISCGFGSGVTTTREMKGQRCGWLGPSCAELLLAWAPSQG